MPAGKPAAPPTDPAQLAQRMEQYLADHPDAAILEDGRILFDMRTAHYTVGADHGRCTLQLWSEERNLIRTVLEVQQRAQCLRLATRRMGAARPQMLEIVPNGNHRTATARDTARRTYLRVLERSLARHWIGWKVDGLRSAMDLEHSFGPAYARGRLVQGTTAHAIIGVGQDESAAVMDGILTLGILWLDYCRAHGDGRRHFGGLKVVVPPGSWRTTAERMRWLNHAAASFELWTLDERSEELAPVDWRDIGNLDPRLVHAFSGDAALERCQAGLDQLKALLPDAARGRVEMHAVSATQVALLLHGLEFARVRHGASAHSFSTEDQVTFGAAPNETPLTAANEDLCRELCARLFQNRRPDGLHSDPLFRMQPERWLESRLRAGIGELFPSLRGDLLYTQVPALAGGDRGMLDLLTLDRSGRLAVVELKASEDLHLPIQALDYWMRVRALNSDRKPGPGNPSGKPLSAFERSGYFPGMEISPLPPRMLLVAPSLQIHPANETVLRYLAPEVEWELIALSQDWRRELSVVFRKRGPESRP